MSFENDANIAHLKCLQGRRITGLCIDDSPGTLADFHRPLYGFQVTGGLVVWIMADPEGNGPGHLDIQPLNPKNR